MIKRFTLLFCSLLLLSNYSTAKKVYVKLATDTEAWQHIVNDNENIVVSVSDGAFNSILSHIQKDDVVWVAKGNYKNTGSINLNGDRAGVKIYGGFKGDETTPEERHLSDKDGNGMIEAWEFTHETRFTGNTEETAGFRMFTLNTAEALLDGVTIADNKYMRDTASGVYLKGKATLRNSILKNVGCAWERESGAVNGGGIFVDGEGYIENCLFEDCYNINNASEGSAYGGAINITGKNSSIKNTIIRNSKVISYKNAFGGGLFINNGATAENCVIYNNEAGFRGGGIYVHDTAGDPVKLINLTVVNNVAANAGGGIFTNRSSCYIYNSVFWGNTNTSGSPNNINLNQNAYVEAFAYNGRQGSGIWMEGKNINPSPESIQLTPGNNPMEELAEGEFPYFIRPTSFAGVSSSDSEEIAKANWNLRPSSSLIDKGVNAINEVDYTMATKDICNNKRPVNSKYDLGAYEVMAWLNGEITDELTTLTTTDLVLEGNWSPENYTTLNNLLHSEITSINLSQVTNLPESLSENLNKNCLIYLDEKAEENFNQINIIKGNIAETIELTDGLPFNAPTSFTTKSIQYTRLPENPDVWANGSEGWSTIILPFAAETYVASVKGAITPFTDNSDTEGAFWLKEYKGSEEEKVYFDFPGTTQMKANHPYILALPGNHWGAEHDLSGQSLLFSAGNAYIPATTETDLSDEGGEGTGYIFQGNYRNHTVTGYLLGEQQSTSNAFALNENISILPFRAYFPTESTSGKKAYLTIGNDNGGTTNMELKNQFSQELQIFSSGNSLQIITPIEQTITIYSLDGLPMRSVELQQGRNEINDLLSGFYIIDGKKVIIK